MARMITGFNAKDNEKMGDFSAIPAGTYIAKIIQSDMKETKNKDGHYLQLNFQIIEGEYSGKMVFERLNIDNKNPQTVEIAQKSLATICDICNVDVLEDSEQLHGVPMNIKVIVKPASAQYSEQNEIKGFEANGGVAATPRAAAIPGASPAGTPPWKQ